jgi:hypothetical protein
LRSGVSPRSGRSGRRSSQGCGTSGSLSGFVDRGTRKPKTPAGYQQAKNEQQGWHQQGQLNGSGSTLVAECVAIPVDDHG